MHLVMVAIDGTLTETMKVDEECFVRSFVEVFGFSDIDTDWSHYRHTTDSGIFRDVYASRTGRIPTAHDESRFRQHFIQLLAAASSRSPFPSVAGAAQLLSRLSCNSAHRVCKHPPPSPAPPPLPPPPPPPRLARPPAP